MLQAIHTSHPTLHTRQSTLHTSVSIFILHTFYCHIVNAAYHKKPEYIKHAEYIVVPEFTLICVCVCLVVVFMYWIMFSFILYAKLYCICRIDQQKCCVFPLYKEEIPLIRIVKNILLRHIITRVWLYSLQEDSALDEPTYISSKSPTEDKISPVSVDSHVITLSK